MKRRLFPFYTVLFMAFALSAPGQARDDVYTDWAPTGVSRAAVSGGLEHQYSRRVGPAGQRDAVRTEFQWRKEFKGSLVSAPAASTVSVTMDWHPTGSVRLNQGAVEYQYYRRVSLHGQRDSAHHEYQWREASGDRSVASASEPSAGTLSVLRDWFPTGLVRARGSSYEFQYARSVGLNGNREQRAWQYEWRVQ